MTWMITASGRDYHFSGPASLEAGNRPVCIEDIGHHLAIINRFNGATIRPYSDAEHSLLCADIAKRMGTTALVQLAALMHDAHEFVTGDMSSPVKRVVNGYSMAAGGVEAWGLFEDEHERVVHKHFNMLTVFRSHADLVHKIDGIALATERRDLTRFNPAVNRPWPTLRDGQHDAAQPVGWVDLNTPEREATTWRQWRDQFIARYVELQTKAQADFSRMLGRQPGVRVPVIGTVA